MCSSDLVGGVVAIDWTETPDFCGRCHTMDPELKAFVTSPHRELTCGECHVEPGPVGWVKSKIKGTKQLFDILMDTYPRPILPPAHEELPLVSDTCLKCHDMTDKVAAGGPGQLVLKNNGVNGSFLGTTTTPLINASNTAERQSSMAASVVITIVRFPAAFPRSGTSHQSRRTTAA